MIKVSLLLALAPIIFGCSNSVREAAAPKSADEPRGLVCEDAKMQRHATNARDCLERGGMLL
jgi:hypothetical protein